MKTQSGLTLIEVLIAVLVLAIGLLGIAGLQSSALSNNFVAYQYTQAATLTQGMLESMRSNRTGVANGYYELTAASSPGNPKINCGTNPCASQDQANWDMAVWYSSVTGTSFSNAPSLVPIDPATHLPTGALPNSATSISCPTPFTTTSICLVTVYWDATRSGNTGYTCTSGALNCFSLAFQQ